MNTNKLTLQELVDVLDVQKREKHDYVVPTRLLKMENGLIVAPDTNGGIYVPNELMHQQIAEKLGIPANYYRKMQTLAPELLDENVNAWFKKSNDKKGSLLRTFEKPDGNIGRALLSDRYGMIDNYDVLFTALEIIKNSGVEVEIEECAITDRRMYVYIRAKNIEVAAPEALKSYLRSDRFSVGDGVVIGMVITNSEVGYGMYNIMPRAEVKVCMNGAVISEDSFRRVHLGAKMDSGKIDWSEDTKKKNLDLIMAQTRDAITQFMSEGYLRGVVQKIERASNVELSQPFDTLQNVVKHISTAVTMTDENKKNILNFFMKDGDVNASGVFHALTREAGNLDADNRFEMEKKAFEILPSIKSFDKPFVTGKN